MQFGHIHFIFGTDFVYDLEKYSWFETFDKDSGQCDFDYLETFKTVIAAGSVMPGLEAAPPLLIYYWPQVISPPLPPSSLHQIHLQIWFSIKYFVRIVQKYLQAISLIFHYWSASWHPIMGDISSTSLTLSQNAHQTTFFSLERHPLTLTHLVFGAFLVLLGLLTLADCGQSWTIGSANKSPVAARH